jgi:hypothetical protein
MRKPHGFYSSMSKEEWMKYGQDNNLKSLSRGELEKKYQRYYTKGLKMGWITGLIPDTKVKPNGFYSNMGKEQWIAYWINNGFDKLGLKELRKNHGRYYQRGAKEGWIHEVSPTMKKPNGFYNNMTKEEWMKYRQENGLDKLSRSELSKTNGAYYKKGREEGWLNDFVPNTRKENGYWSMNTILDESRAIVKEKGYLPSYDELNDMGRADIGVAIAKNGGMFKLREMLGLNQSRKPENYWNLDNILKECREIVDEKGYLPAQTELKITHPKLISAISKKGGGLTKIRKMLNLPLNRKPNKFYKNMTQEQWLAFGKENGLDKLSRTNLMDAYRGYYQKGNDEGWLDSLIPKSNSLESQIQAYIGMQGGAK